MRKHLYVTGLLERAVTMGEPLVYPSLSSTYLERQIAAPKQGGGWIESHPGGGRECGGASRPSGLS